ncbi:YbhN family protein [Actinoplanes sp. NEAU-A12]|uniref:YbhN family protein n=1 Tax=Actinoplanes sandaracinus TaxID=3045177 RepID=A0ABT6WPY9_9ACTN|nr:YbhN family protein [Actinoplanes sandaracinus]MDI6101773.1 YbhN family protein [Actinoplanes sandaracinus]
MTTLAEKAAPAAPARAKARWIVVVVVAAILGAELALGWQSLADALTHLRAPHLGWLAAALLAGTAAIQAYARMQRHLLRSAGVRVSLLRHTALAYAAHSLSVTLPGGPAFSTALNYRQMRRFGASPAIASWCIALSGILSAAALALITAFSTITANGTPDPHTFVALAVAALLATIGVRRLTRHPSSLTAVTRPVLIAVNRLRHRPADHGQERIQGFLEQLRAARLTPGHGAAAVTYALLNWLLDAACLWLCSMAVGGGSIGAGQLMLAFCAGMAAGTITIIPGGLGIIDGALILGLMAGGITAEIAIAVVVLYRLITLGFIIGVGWLSYLAIRRGGTR